MKKLALFDLDGTLFDTRDVNYYAYKEALEKYDFQLDYNYYTKQCNGRHYTEFLPIITNNAGEDMYEKIHSIKKIAYRKYLSKAKINDKLFDIIRLYKESNYILVVVTTASKTNTFDILKCFNVFDLFDLIVTSEDYERTKPYPDGFIYAMNKYNISNINTIIFEDSDVGIAAALATGSTVFKIENF